VISTLSRWLASPEIDDGSAPELPNRIDWFRAIPFAALHLGCLAVFWVGFSWTAFTVAVFLYALRVFSLTAFYHRYFSHRAFKTSRLGQFLFGVLGCLAIQRGPLWWAAHHRRHHTESDTHADPHSPVQHGFWWSHMGWFLTPAALPTHLKRIPDLARYPELRFLNRFDLVIPILLGVSLYFLGESLHHHYPALGTTGWQLFVWGFCLSTVCVYHVTFLINSLAHTFGRRVYATADDSRNNVWLAVVTFGEGWHNNHHHYPASARQGFHWWQIDISYGILVGLSWLGIVWDLKPVPAKVLDANRIAIDRNDERHEAVVPETTS